MNVLSNKKEIVKNVLLQEIIEYKIQAPTRKKVTDFQNTQIGNIDVGWLYNIELHNKVSCRYIIYHALKEEVNYQIHVHTGTGAVPRAPTEQRPLRSRIIS